MGLPGRAVPAGGAGLPPGHQPAHRPAAVVAPTRRPVRAGCHHRRFPAAAGG